MAGGAVVRDVSELAALDLCQRPIWILDLDARRPWWGNAAALRLWRVDDVETLRRQDIAAADAVALRRLDALFPVLDGGGCVEEVWTIHPEGGPVAVTCTLSPLRLADDRRAMMVEATADADPGHAEAQRMSEALRHAGLMVSLFTLDGTLITRNPAATARYGVPSPEDDADGLAVAATWMADTELWAKAVAMARHGDEFTGELQVLTIAGWRWHHIKLRSCRDPVTGQCVLLMIEDDVTELREQREHEIRVRSALDIAPIPMLMLDRDDRVVMWNQALARFNPLIQASAGLTFEEHLRATQPRGPGTGVPEDAIEEVIRQRLDRHRNYAGPFESHWSGDTWFLVSEHKTPDGSTVIALVDISERKRAEAERAAAHAKLEAIVDFLPIGLYLCDTEQRCELVNATACRFLRQPREALLGKTAFDVLPPEVAARLETSGREALIQGRPVFREETIERKGKHLDIYFGTTRIQVDGRTKLLTFTINVTDLREAERLAREHQEFLSLLIDTDPNLVFVKDAEGRFRFINGAFATSFGLPRDAILGHFNQDVHGTPAEAERHLADDRQVIETGRTITVEEPFTTRDGTVRWYQTTKAPLDTTDAGRCVLAIATDITAQKAAEAKLAEANRTLERKVAERTAALAEALERTDLANRAKAQFLANMSHELRTPLNAIIGFAQLLREEIYGPIRDDQRAAIGDIEASGTHLLSVLSDVLDAAKIDAGHIELRETDIDVRALVDSCHRLMRTRAADAGVDLRIAVSPAMPAIRADATKLKQMLINLLSNAIKFTPRGGVVAVSAGPTKEGGLAVAVRDTGIGMAPEHIPLALEPFRQVESSFTRNYDGTGLGLFITKKFAEAHGGALRIDSARGHGTTVEITLPAWRIPALPTRAAE